MYQPLVSVVIPVYNMENYIERCILNLQKQTYENLEIIIVDDGSKDKTQGICDLMSKENQRIKFYSKSNEGVSSARNFALKYATGKYVTFVDADDIIHEKHIEYLVSLIESEAVDLAVTMHVEVKEQVTIDIKEFKEQDSVKEILTRAEFVNHLYDDDKYKGYLWNKMFKMSIIREHDIKMPDGINIFEDMVFIYRYARYINQVKYGHMITYYYVQHTESAMKNINQAKFLQSIEAREKIINDAIEEDECFINITKEKYVTLAMGYIKGKMIKDSYYDKSLLQELVLKSLGFRNELNLSYKYYIELMLLRYFTSVLKMFF